MDIVKVQHRFTIERDGYTLQDALYFDLIEYQTIADAEIEKMKEERFQNHVIAMKERELEIARQAELEAAEALKAEEAAKAAEIL